MIFGATGCATTPDTVENGPKTLLKWAAQPDDAKPKADDEAPTDVEPLITDRPDFTEASSTVGKGRVQLEAGYTYSHDRSGGTTTSSHSFPEALLRIGLFADWFELRVAQNAGYSRSRSTDGIARTGGAEDLYLGTKLALAEQQGVLPEVAVILQAQVPTGSRDNTAGSFRPGASLLYSWDVVKDRISLGGSTLGNRAVEDDAHEYVQFAQSITVGYTLTPKLGAYTEWFAFFPSGATGPGAGPQHYFNGGFTYRLTPDFQLDARAGCGLNRRADDFFAGTGFAVRY